MYGLKSYNKCSKCCLSAMTHAHDRFCHSFIALYGPLLFPVCQVATVVMETT